MSNIAITLHLLAAVIWVGGMFFAILAVRPALVELDTLLRARLWAGIFRRFFPWVGAAILTLLVTGFYMIFSMFGGFAQTPPFVQSMMGLGIFMMLLFGHLFFVSYKRLKRSVTDNDETLAKRSMSQIRLVVTINLVLGLVVVFVAMMGIFALTD